MRFLGNLFANRRDDTAQLCGWGAITIRGRRWHEVEGYIRKITVFGVTMIRIDIPLPSFGTLLVSPDQIERLELSNYDVISRRYPQSTPASMESCMANAWRFGRKTTGQ